MIKRVLGRTRLEVTQLGYGSMEIRGPRTWGVRVVSEEAADEFLNAVLDAGINFIVPILLILFIPSKNTNVCAGRIWQLMSV